MKRKTIPLTDENYYLLKRYCVRKGEFLSHVANRILRDFLKTSHWLIESKGEMIIEGEQKRPRTIVEVIKDEEEPRRSLKDIKIVRKGNRYIVKKKRS